MPYRFLDHTADIRMHVTGHVLPDLFSAAASGLLAFMSPVQPDPARPVRRTVSLQAGDTTALLIDFLNEVLLHAQTDREYYDRVSIRSLTENELQADLSGCRVAGYQEDVKAVTYHEADVHQGSNGWATTIVFDI